MDVVDVERYPGGAAAGAGPAPLGEEVFAGFCAVQGAVLVLGPLQWSAVGHGVGIERDPLHVHRAHGCPAREPAGPRHGGVHAVPQRRGEPALGTGAIGEAGRAVAQVPGAPTPPVRGTRGQLVLDDGAPVGEFDRVQAAPLTIFGCEHGDTSALRARVDPEFRTIHLRSRDRAVFEPDHERGVPGYDGPALLEELAGPRGAGGLEWCAVLVQDEHDGVALTGPLPNQMVGGDAIDARCDTGGLPSHMYRAGCLTAFESRFVPDPGGVC